MKKTRKSRPPAHVIDFPTAHAKFKQLMDDIEAERPDIVKEARKAVSELIDPATATVDDCWKALWNKPLYRWGRVTTPRAEII